MCGCYPLILSKFSAALAGMTHRSSGGLFSNVFDGVDAQAEMTRYFLVMQTIGGKACRFVFPPGHVEGKAVFLADRRAFPVFGHTLPPRLPLVRNNEKGHKKTTLEMTIASFFYARLTRRG